MARVKDTLQYAREEVPAVFLRLFRRAF
jgi:hypothetical protein